MNQLPFDEPVEQPEYLSQMQKEALARMKNIVERRGLGVLSGDIGSGKSTLFRMLAASLPNTQYHVIYLCSAGLLPKELYTGILRELGEQPGFSLGKVKQQWRTLLDTQLADGGRQLVIMIDEAHELPANTLLELRFLMNHKMDFEPPFSLILAGQGRLRTDLRLKAFEAIAQRVKMQYHLSGMTLDEVNKYVETRMKKAGLERPIFAESALTLAHASSHGMPRVINQICGQALYVTQQNGDNVIEEKHIIAVLADMDRQRGAKG
jgi:type II secretory pathway predicted ATPase ExeA